MALYEPLEPTRAAGLQRLEAFLPSAGSHYARERNTDRGPSDRANVSMLSAYLRHRLIGEDEVVRKVVARHGMKASAKFVEEVCWRTYWKGWLELRPRTWTDYLDELAGARAALDGDPETLKRYDTAVHGRTGIPAFDAWARELIETGYLHNHARMWFASIWIFTLRLPWTLGADFFLRHLIDGDAASNTLSWRWVAGLHTTGKAYAARAENISQCTEGRFDVRGMLDEMPEPLTEHVSRPAGKLRPVMSMPPGAPVVLLLTEDDLCAEQWPLDPDGVRGVAAMMSAASYPGLAEPVSQFRIGAIQDGLHRAAKVYSCPVLDLAAGSPSLSAFCHANAAELIVTAHVPVGPARSDFEALIQSLAGTGLGVIEVRRAWDAAFWPHARRGYFDLKSRIPETLERLELI